MGWVGLGRSYRPKIRYPPLSLAWPSFFLPIDFENFLELIKILQVRNETIFWVFCVHSILIVRRVFVFDQEETRYLNRNNIKRWGTGHHGAGRRLISCGVSTG